MSAQYNETHQNHKVCAHDWGRMLTYSAQFTWKQNLHPDWDCNLHLIYLDTSLRTAHHGKRMVSCSRLRTPFSWNFDFQCIPPRRKETDIHHTFMMHVWLKLPWPAAAHQEISHPCHFEFNDTMHLTEILKICSRFILCQSHYLPSLPTYFFTYIGSFVLQLYSTCRLSIATHILDYVDRSEPTKEEWRTHPCIR